MNDSAKASPRGFPYVFILAALNLIDARRIPSEAKPFVYKQQFCAKYLTQTQLAQINEALSTLSDDAFLSFVIGDEQEAKRLTDLPPSLQIASELFTFYSKPAGLPPESL